MNGYPKASDFIGTVSQKWNEQKQRVDGEFWFYDEVPDEVRDNIINGWPTPISAGFTVEDTQNGVQKGMFYTHVAILRDKDDPKCPLGQCGINVRMESNLTEKNYRYEQATDPSEPAKPPKAEPYDPVGLGVMIGEMKAEIAQLRKQLEETKPVPQKQEVSTQPEQEAHAVEPEASQQETPRATQRILPAGESPKEEELKRDPITGCIIL